MISNASRFLYFSGYIRTYFRSLSLILTKWRSIRCKVVDFRIFWSIAQNDKYLELRIGLRPSTRFMRTWAGCSRTRDPLTLSSYSLPKHWAHQTMLIQGLMCATWSNRMTTEEVWIQTDPTQWLIRTAQHRTLAHCIQIDKNEAPKMPRNNLISSF